MIEPFVFAERGRPAEDKEYRVKQEFNFSGTTNTISGNPGLNMLVDTGIRTEYINEWTKGELNGMKINSFFCGAGGFDLGFIQAGFEIVGAYDFDKYAVESYNHNIGGAEQADVTKMKGSDLKYANGWLFGFPCQDISVAGKQKGMIKGETRSGLFYEIMRLLDEVSDKPEWILAENVKAVNKFIPTIEEEYAKAGYRLITPQLYNSKYWGIPQNRERYFLLGIRENLYRLFAGFKFPQQQTDFIPKLSSVLESNVDEKFYIDDLKAAKIIEQAISGLKVKQATKKGYDIAVEGDSINISHPNSQTRRGRVGKQVAQTLLTGTEQVVVLKDVHACITPDRVDKRQNGRRAKDNEEEMFTLTSQDLHGVIQASYSQEGVGTYNPKKEDGTQTYQQDRIYDVGGISPAVSAELGGRMNILEQPKIEMLGLLDMKGNETIRRVYNPDGLSPTLTTSEGGHRQPKILEEIQSVFTDKDGAAYCCDANYAKGTSPGDIGKGRRTHIVESMYRVRKLTPREYARLQGFPDSYEQVVSNSQFYKQMGNAVTVNVAHAIAKAIKEQL